MKDNIIKIKRDYSPTRDETVFVYVCRKHGCSSDKPFRCSCLEHYPNYEYREGKF